ncbi:PTS mannitol transporter subunit IIBC [Nocardioides flavus (ex Wang et al. 2016)]|uniref:PTS system mannitol-specific EIICB component n=1 Tax=Nocardioides flavus (ex Wang et al. 2016) TaxID=2058780 RepID=A0ABQ3HPZ4_9ACTN|nr:PTS mannitol transporter subunit IICB [Nocardioides flavus (ex Wang et al. 2016)]GHE18527.1 PTS mannitol transporter subunit IIBC [Nocardioides flavus (ex Wang et al. 2016)]
MSQPIQGALPAETGPGLRARIQAFGGFLTAMVIPNVGAFIAWGLLTALFIPTGWLPNEDLAAPVEPMIVYLLPLLLAFTGGRLVHGHRGGVAGAVGTIGLIVGADIPMFLGAMIMGPLSAWLIKQVDRVLEPKIRSGFEMVVNNFTLGFLGLGLIVTSYKVIGPVISALNDQLLRAINALVDTGALPLLSVLNEPAKVLFLNNVIDQGIYYPLGLQVAADEGKSIFFMVASNPGPGLGLLLAFWMFGHNRVIRDSAPGAVIIHFLGGIHEIYFPYVLMKPLTILAMIAGGASGIATFMLFDVGLTAGPSPGSIFAYLALTPPGNHVGVIAGVLVAAAVSFVITAAILKLSRTTGDEDESGLEEHAERSRAMKAEGSAVLTGVMGGAGGTGGTDRTAADVRRIVFACDAGMGSSAMGASAFGKRLRSAGRDDVRVTHAAIESVPVDADLVVVHQDLAHRARAARPGVEIVTIQSYLGDPALDALSERLTERTTTDAEQ